jgi:hypothetical protein
VISSRWYQLRDIKAINRKIMFEIFIFSFFIIIFFSLALYFKGRADEKRDRGCGLMDGNPGKGSCSGGCSCSTGEKRKGIG